MMRTYWRLWVVALSFPIVGSGHGMYDAQSAWGEGLAPWASNTHSTDVAKRHVEEITAGRHEYAVTQGGTMDGQNCSSPVGVWTAWQQTWESNRQVRMENVGDTDVGK